MKVELIEIGRVIPYARNPRRNENAIAKVAASIKEYGFRQPIVVDEEMVIIAGHTRLQAAQSLGLKKVPVHVADGLTQAQIKAYRLADNRTHEDAEWDEDLLAIELGELGELGFDLDLTGFDAIELEELLGNAAIDGLTDDDEVPEAPEIPVSKEGDVWLLGDHRLICGDSTKAKTMKALMGDELADMVFTDPPYNVDYGQTMKDNLRGKRMATTLARKSWFELEDFANSKKAGINRFTLALERRKVSGQEQWWGTFEYGSKKLKIIGTLERD